jgi:hypothetical protein
MKVCPELRVKINIFLTSVFDGDVFTFTLRRFTPRGKPSVLERTLSGTHSVSGENKNTWLYRESN